MPPGIDVAAGEAAQDAGGQIWVIGGLVQGVGFRPFVCILARELGLLGSVRNVGGQVQVVAGTGGAGADRFLQRLLSEHPACARPRLVATGRCPAPRVPGFSILPSLADGAAGTVLPDVPPCDDCLAEMADPDARRFRHPFIACAHCGPRYTVMASMPFDRPATAMAGFPLCDACRAEYEHPGDRRFHAQLLSCARCGPSLTFCEKTERLSGNEPALARAVARLRDGAIVAVRGIGGYHLLADAAGQATVLRLRSRKRRPAKPLAVMFPHDGPDGLDALRRHCTVAAEAARRLLGHERPIVLVPLRPDHELSPALTPGLLELGALLPYSPLHRLLLEAFGGPLIATSGNLSGEPVLSDPAEAECDLAGIADAFLHHDRPILNPADDGVMRVIRGRARRLRVGRGAAPLELALPRTLDAPVLAVGGHMKVTVALGLGRRAVMSPHVGDLDSPRGLDRFEATAATLQRLHGVRAGMLICDLHPGYTTTRWAARQGLPILAVGHHEAHAAAVAGEFQHEPRWLCFTWDGAGLGNDGTLWGGEALLGRPGAWVRVGTFRTLSPPGGDKAAREPWRSAAALAWELGIAWAPSGIDVGLAQTAFQRRLNCPQTSAVGRLFDAAAALLGLVQHASHNGEGPMAVEAIAVGTHVPAPLPLRERLDGVLEADWSPLVPMLLDRLQPPEHRAGMLHAQLAATLVAQAVAIRRTHGAFAVGLCGGVFQNRRLAELALDGLEVAGFVAHLPARVPCNDAGLSFGQLVEAAARQHS